MPRFLALNIEFTAKDTVRAVERGDLIIVIDVLRSCTSVISALANGAKAIIPTKTLKEACRLKVLHPDYILAGERRGNKPKGFDFGNSPLEFTSEKVKGKNLILTTTSGTTALARARGAELVFVGTFLNAGAMAKKAAEAAEEKHVNVSFVLAGDKGHFSFEDFVCAGAMAMRFNKGKVYFSDKVLAARLAFNQTKNNLCKKIQEAEHAKHLIELGFGKDIEFACQLDVYNITPIYRNGKITSLDPDSA